LQEFKRHYTPSIVKEHTGPGTIHLIYHFENGYGASVIPEYDFSLGGLVPIDECLELAVVYWDSQDDYHLLDYDDPIILDKLPLHDNPVRRLTSLMVSELLDQIAAL
jgi:hypothetical protein